MQDDDFANPSFLWLDYGAELWEDVNGEAGKACSDCHGDAEDSMKDVGARYPVFSAELGKPISLEQRINKCRVENMQADPWKWESRELLGATTYVRNQSRGMPVQVQIDGPMAPFYEKGKAFYFQRRGLLDMACANCHVDNAGNMIRANLLTQGQSNGFPLYRLKWNGVGSIHRRFRGCNEQVRSTPYQPVEKGVIDRVSRHGEAYRGEGGFAILRDDEDDLNDQDGSSGRNKHEQGANSARHGLLRGAGADELAHQQR